MGSCRHGRQARVQLQKKRGHVPTILFETYNPTHFDKIGHLDVFESCPLHSPEPKTQQSGHVTPFFRNCMRAGVARFQNGFAQH